MTFVPPDVVSQIEWMRDCPYCFPGDPCILHRPAEEATLPLPEPIEGQTELAL